MWEISDPRSRTSVDATKMRRAMRWSPFVTTATLVAAIATAARADDLDRLRLDTGRLVPPAPEADTYRAMIHGEHQLRFQAERSFPLTPAPAATAARPGLLEQSLGQNFFVHHWL